MKQIKHLPYPETERGDVVDNYFGTEVPDPYRWLEDDNSEATAAWVAAENAVTQDYLSQIPFRGAIRERLTELWNYPKEGAPAKHGDWWYYTYNDGLQNQAVIWRTKEPGHPGRGVPRPQHALRRRNGGAGRHVVLEGWTLVRLFGRRVGFRLGGDPRDGHRRQVARRRQDRVGEVLGARWAPDSKGFYYSAYDAPKKSTYSSKNEFQKVYYHELGTPQSADKLVYEDKAHPLRYFSAVPSDDGKWLFIVGSEGTSGNEILYKKVSEPKFRTLLPGFDADYMPVDCKDDALFFVTNEGASNYALKRIGLNAPAKVATVIPEDGKNLLEGVGTAGGYLFASYLQDAQSQVRQYDYDGRWCARSNCPPSVRSAASTARKKTRSSTTRCPTTRRPRPFTNTTSPRAHRRSTRPRR